MRVASRRYTELTLSFHLQLVSNTVVQSVGDNFSYELLIYPRLPAFHQFYCPPPLRFVGETELYFSNTVQITEGTRTASTCYRCCLKGNLSLPSVSPLPVYEKTGNTRSLLNIYTHLP